jgi:hypothetical protein
LALTVVSISPVAASVPAGTPVGVTFTIAARANAAVGVYPAALQIMARQNGVMIRLGPDFAFNVAVTRLGRVITWTPASLGTIKLLQGQTMTQTVSFTSTMALTSVQIRSDLSSAQAAHGVTLDVVSMTPATTAVAAGQPVSVTLTLSAAPDATPGIYPTGLHVMGSFDGGPVIHLADDVYFPLVVAPLTPLVTWVNGSPMSFPTISRGTATVGVTETASLSSNVSLSNVALVGKLSDRVSAQGLTISLVPVPGGAIAANTPVAVSFVIGVPATAQPGVYSGDIWLTAQRANTTAAVRLTRKLHFVFAVN